MKRLIDTKRGSTIALRLAAATIGLGILALCVFLLPSLWTDAYDEYPDYGYAVRIIVAAMYLAAIPFYYGIYKGWKVLDAIDAGKIFAKQPVRALRTIARCAGTISLIYITCLPFFYIWADNDDAPGLMVIGLFMVAMPLIVSVAIGLLGRILRDATTIKSENDLTV